MSHTFRVHDSELLVEAPILAVRRDRVEMPGGALAHREVVEHFGAVAVVAYDAEAEAVALVKQYRHPVARRLWELPAGLLDVAQEDPVRAGLRELVEEAGLKASQWDTLVDMVTSPGFCDEAVRVFLARGLEEVDRPEPEEEEADMTLSWIPLAQARSMILRGEIVNSIAIAGIFAAHEVLKLGAEARPAQAPFEVRSRALAERREAINSAPGRDLKRP